MNGQRNVHLVLASGSPRRKVLLESMGLAFSVLVTDTDESVRIDEAPLDYVQRLARDKAQAARAQLAEQSKLDKPSQAAADRTFAILAADTIVCQHGDIIGKPQDQADAFRIWHQLSQTKHQVMTAVCLIAHAKIVVRVCTTDVEFGPISDAQMVEYWRSGEPVDKAGAYAIQGRASAWVKLIHGSYSNVVGLPLYEVNELLTTVDLNWL